jgi:Holliday junction resolvase-like predicted endonuclease
VVYGEVDLVREAHGGIVVIVEPRPELQGTLDSKKE